MQGSESRGMGNGRKGSIAEKGRKRANLGDLVKVAALVSGGGGLDATPFPILPFEKRFGGEAK